MLMNDISRTEVLGYLKFYDKNVPPGLEVLLDRAMDQVKSAAVPRTVWREYPLEFLPTGVQVVERTAFARKGYPPDLEAVPWICLAATWARDWTPPIRTAQVSDMAYALVLDACASAGVEAVLDALEKELPAGTRRYSPGYGDLPLSLQKDFSLTLDTPRRIGLCVSDSLTLLPRKSVTAIIGVRRKP